LNPIRRGMRSNSGKAIEPGKIVTVGCFTGVLGVEFCRVGRGCGWVSGQSLQRGRNL
jgi:hypothetical protein